MSDTGYFGMLYKTVSKKNSGYFALYFICHIDHIVAISNYLSERMDEGFIDSV